MKNSLAWLLSVALMIIAPLAPADPARARALHPDQNFDVAMYRESDGWIIADTNGDGQTDYALKLDQELKKEMEVIDFNNDGSMDNFYFYRRDARIREELDTNHNGHIDLWIHIEGGVYIVRYERDTNHDGQIDLVKRFVE